MTRKISSILIANRGEIAVRIIRSCRDLNISPIAIYSETDCNALHVRMSDQAICVGPAPAPESYLNIKNVIQAALTCGADAIHPGYGFLAENSSFAQAVIDAGIIWIGPPPSVLDGLGSKTSARQFAKKAKVPIVPGTIDPVKNLIEAKKVASDIGYPIMLKAVAGGGGKGMRIVHSENDLERALKLAEGEAQQAFGNGSCYLEKYISSPHHIEVQILADQHGNTFHILERECSIQRRHQKILEEAPSPFINSTTRKRICAAAVNLVKTAGYVGAGTVEFLTDENQNFYFLEVNPRIQVEHPITELITGIDLVAEQIRIASGERISFKQKDVVSNGHAIECRIYAEDPLKNFIPSPGNLSIFKPPQGPGIRLDSGVESDTTIPMEYDPIIGKLCTWGKNREQAISRMKRALNEFQICGVANSIAAHLPILDHPEFISGNYSTNFCEQYGEQLFIPEAKIPHHAIIGALIHTMSLVNTATDTSYADTNKWRDTARNEGVERGMDR